MFNVDRWAYYTAQKLNPNNYHHRQLLATGFMPNMTPAQLRRCKKKARRRNDWSIGLYVGDGYERA